MFRHFLYLTAVYLLLYGGNIGLIELRICLSGARRPESFTRWELRLLLMLFLGGFLYRRLRLARLGKRVTLKLLPGIVDDVLDKLSNRAIRILSLQYEIMEISPEGRLALTGVVNVNTVKTWHKSVKGGTRAQKLLLELSAEVGLPSKTWR